MLALAFLGCLVVLQQKDIDILTEMPRRQQICLYILELNYIPQLDVIKLGNLYNWQTLQRKALVTSLIAMPLVGTQWRSFISWHVLIRMFLQVRPCYLQGSRLITKSIAISAYCYIGTSRGYNSPQYFVLKALARLQLQQAPIKRLTKSIILGQKQYWLRSLQVPLLPRQPLNQRLQAIWISCRYRFSKLGINRRPL